LPRTTNRVAVFRVRDHAGTLTIGIPRVIMRELGIRKGQLCQVQRGAGRSIVVIPLREFSDGGLVERPRPSSSPAPSPAAR